MIPIPRGIVRLAFSAPFPAPNVLNVESVPLTTPDFFFIGPIVCHYGG